MSNFYERPLPEYIDDKENKESFKWHGFDSGFDVFPHLNLDWQQIQQVYEETKKPIGDLGSSFSTIPAEAELRGVKVIPIDLMHEYHRDDYLEKVFMKFNDWKLRLTYNKDLSLGHRLPQRVQETMGTVPISNFRGKLQEAIEKVMERYVVGDLSRIPLQDRALSISIVHDTVPKHSKDLEEFLTQQLPEILRVTDRTAYIYPISMYKVEQLQEDEEASRDVLVEAQALYKDPEAIERIRQAAEAAGFEFSLEQGSESKDKVGRYRPETISLEHLNTEKQTEAKLAVFKRK